MMSDNRLRLVATSKGLLPQLHHLPFVLPVRGMLRAIDGGIKGILHKGMIQRGYDTQVYTCRVLYTSIHL